MIADDLTGAADTALAFWRAGLSTVIVPGAGQDAGTATPTTTAPVRADVIVLSTETRNLPLPRAAREALLRAAARYLPKVTAAPAPLLYKKIDSTLRGWVGAEVRALLDALPDYVAWIAPAYPQQGRQMRGGVYRIRGVLLNETEFAADVHGLGDVPLPIPLLLAAQMGERVGFVGGASLIFSPTKVARIADDAVHLAAGDFRRATVFDAETDAELKRIVEAGEKAVSPLLWVGSAGLAGPLAAQIAAKEAGRPAPRRFCPEIARSPVALVAGSQSRTVTEQIAFLREKMPGTRHMVLPPDGGESGAVGDIADTAVGSPSSALLTLPRALASELAALSPGERLEVADRFGEAAAGIIRRLRSERFLLTGGDTASAVCRHLHVEALEVIGAVEDGMPLLRVRGGSVSGALVVTKAGGFGTRESLYRAFTVLAGQSKDT